MNTSYRLPILALCLALISTAGAQSDAFATATPIVTLPVTGNNLTATREPGEANHGNNPGGASVWWSWTATATRHFRVTLAGSGFDTVMGIYTGAAVDNTLLVTQNDDTGTGVLTSSAVIYVRTGQTVLIAVDGYNDGAVTDAGTITLNIQPLPAGEVPPANDLFAAAAVLNGMSGNVVGSNLYASREVGEPRLAAMAGGTSLWWKWTAPENADMEFSLNGATTAVTPVNFNTGIAIYTGTSLGTLAPVTFSGPGLTNKVYFAAIAGTTYFITADTATTTFVPQTGNLTLRFQRSYIHVVFPAGVAWDWLNPAGIDPAQDDPDFNTTWYNSTVYDGQAFNSQGGALLGYGGIDGAPTVTNILDPGEGSRYTAYFRRQFTMTEASPKVEALILADDGAFIYLDGALVQTFNMPGGAVDAYPQLALAGSEAGPSRVLIGAVSAGVHEIAVSVHNSAAASSDLGFSLALIIDNTPDPALTPAGIGTGFEEPVVGATGYLRFSNGNLEIGWTSTGGVVQAPANHPAGQGNAPSNKFFRLNSARANPFHSERVSLAKLTAQQRASIVASAKVRTFTTSTSGFEEDDDLTISLQSSTDGENFTTAADILPRTQGGTPDQLLAISQATGDFVRFSTVAGAVPAGATHVRLSFLGGNNVSTEFIYVDDLRLELSNIDPLADSDGDGQSNAAEAAAGTDPADPLSVLRITAITPAPFTPTPTFTLTFDGVTGKFYLIEYSEPLTGAWTIVRDDIFAAATAPVVEAGIQVPAAEQGFLRVRVKP